MRLGPLLGPDIKEILKEDPSQLRALLEELELHPEDLADLVSELDPADAGKLLSQVLPADEAAPIFERLEDHEQQEVAVEMPAESVARIASEMEPDERADLFSVLPPELGDQVFTKLEKVDAEAAEEVREIEQYSETAAGHLMTTKYVSVPPHTTVEGALAAVKLFVRENPDSPVYNTYVMHDAKLVGLMSLRELVAADSKENLDDIARTNIITVPPLMDQEEVARYMAKYDLAVIPVVDEKGVLHGVITIDDIVDVLTQEQTEDVQKIGAVEPLDVPYFQTSFFTFIKKRAGWLVILFFGEFFTQTALRYYEPIMNAVAGALLYVPLLISAGGNSGSQSSTLIIRGLAVGEVKMRDWWRVLLRELAMGITLGVIIAAIAIGRVLMYPDQSGLFAATVGLTVFFIVIAGCTVGSMLPLVLKRVGIDPATSSTPFIASLVDTIGVIIYAHVAKIVLAKVIAAAVVAHP